MRRTLHLVVFMVVFMVLSIGCAPSNPAAVTPAPAEPRHLTLLKQVHQAPRYTTALLEADLVSPQVTWWVAGDSTRLPWAGTRHGTAGIDDFSRVLGQHMRYAGFTVREYLVAEDQVTVVIFAHGTARATGKPFASDVVRIYDFQSGRITRVRSFYDTDAYARALQP